jgi:hypothetical protein
VIRGGRSGLAAGKAHRHRAGAIIGLDVDEADHAPLDLAPGTLQGGADASLCGDLPIPPERLMRALLLQAALRQYISSCANPRR